LIQIPDPYVYGIVVAVATSIATLTASKIASRASRKSAESAFDGVTRQIDFQKRAKIAEFRQQWINELRHQMASLQSLGVTPNLQHQFNRRFFEAGTSIELLMNREDPRYAELQDRMYAFLYAKSLDEKFSCNAPFVSVCQDILKTEWEVLKKDLAEVNVE
jgi:hypothetical protein